MSRRTATIPAGYFDDLYAADSDPWRFRTSDYERGKYEDTLAILGRDHYASALDVGCSIGVFTRMLAPRCTRLDALDASDIALIQARQECADLPNVFFALGAIPNALPIGPVDLIVLSEVLYYLTAEDVARAAGLCRAALGPGGEIVACHWLGETDYPLTGDEAVEAFRAGLGPDPVEQDTRRRERYRLDRFRLPRA